MITYKQIRRARLMRDFSVKEMATKLQVDESTYSRLEPRLCIWDTTCINDVRKSSLWASVTLHPKVDFLNRGLPN